MKKILLSLFGFITLGLLNFSNAGSYTYTGTFNGDVSSRSYIIPFVLGFPMSSFSDLDTYNISCTISDFSFDNVCNLGNGTRFICMYNDQKQNISLSNFNGNGTYTFNTTYYNSFGFLLKIYLDSSVCVGNLTFNWTCIVSGNNVIDQSGGSSSCDYSEYENTIQTLSGNLATCQGMYDRLDSDYDLLEGNYNTCTSELSSCMENSGSSGSGDVQWSSLYINNVQHLGNKNIYFSIPDYINFTYTNEGDNFEIDVQGLNQDEEYLSSVINKQNYIPTSEDLSNVLGNLGLFGSLLVVCLFVILVFYMIKKIFD